MKLGYPDYKAVPISGRLKYCIGLARKVGVKNKKIADVGCSNGLVANILAKSSKKYIGIDPSITAINFAKKRIKKADFLVSTADKLPIKDNSQDLVFMFDVIEHVPKRTERKVFKESLRILKKGGKFILTTPFDHPITTYSDPAWYLGHRHYSIDKMSKLLKSSGFTVNEIGVTGSAWTSIYTVWFYIMKWIFGKNMPRNGFLEKKDDEGFMRKGINTLYVIATA